MSKITYELIDGKKNLVLEEFNHTKVNFDSKPLKIKFNRDEKLQYPSFVKNVVAGKTTIRSRPVNPQILFATKTTNAPLTNRKEPAYIPTHNLYLNRWRNMFEANRISYKSGNVVLSKRQQTLINALCL